MVRKFYLWLESLCDPFPRRLPEKPPDRLLRFIAHYAKPFWPLLLVSSILSTVVAVLEVWLFSLVGDLVDLLAAADRATFWAEHWLGLTGGGLLVLVVLPALKFAYESIHHQGLLGNFAMRIRWQAHRYLLRQSIEFYQDDFAGRVAAKVMQTALAIRDTVMSALEILLHVCVYFAGAVVLFAVNDPRLALPMLLWLAGYILTMRRFMPDLRKISSEQAEARSMVTGRIVDSYTNISTVKLFAHTTHEDAYAREGMGSFLGNVYRQMRMVTSLTFTLNMLNALLLFSVAATAVWLWHVGQVTTGAVAFSVGLVIRLQGVSQSILWEVAEFSENIGVVQDGMELISRKRAVSDVPDAVPLRIRRGGIVYRNIHFNYGRHREGDVGRGVIEGLNLEIEPGEKVGIVGRSGAGKSTLVGLLLRFYDLDSGTIEIDGQNVAAVTQESLRAQVGVVTQDISLLHRSISENIRYGRAHVGAAEVEAAAKKAHAHEFILGLEDAGGRRGYDAQVGERGVRLSGGQRQRIAIARVLLKDAPILVLDEATSALDSEIESAIQESLYSLMHGKTVIAIAHRLSTIAAMDRLVVMDGGEIVEQGSHRTLLARQGLYARLWARQSGGFLVPDASPDE